MKAADRGCAMDDSWPSLRCDVGYGMTTSNVLTQICGFTGKSDRYTRNRCPKCNQLLTVGVVFHVQNDLNPRCMKLLVCLWPPDAAACSAT